MALAYVNHQPVTEPTPEIAEHERDPRADQVRDADKLIAALDEELARCETGLIEHRRQRDEAAGLLVSRSAEFLNLFERLRGAFAELRSCRRAIGAVSPAVSIRSRSLILREGRREDHSGQRRNGGGYWARRCHPARCSR